METDEILDLVDHDDRVIGQIRRVDSPKLATENLGYIRASDMFIRNSQGKLWIPKRPPHKTIAPNGLDYSCGGHVTAGDDYDTTITKEIEEELNFTPVPAKLHFIIKMPPAVSSYFRAVYIYDSDETPVYNPEDFVGAEWMSPEELLQKLESGVPAKSSIKETIEKLKELGEL